MRPGGPPRNSRSGQRPEGARGCLGHVQFGKSPQRPPSRTRCPSPKPSGSAAVRGCIRHRRRDSPRHVWTAALPPGRGRLRMSPRPRASEVRGPTPGTPAASQASRNRASPGAAPAPRPPVAREAAAGGGPCRGKAGTSGELLPGQRVCKMAAPMELFCWSGGWGLPSVDLDSLAVLTYTRFTGAPLKIHKISNPWQSPSGTLPALRTSNGEVLSAPHKIITRLRREKYNADYDLSARQGADTLAFMSLLEEKLLPVLIHTFWVDAKNYVEVTRKWYAEAMPFPLNFFLPGRMQRKYMERLQLLCGEHRPETEEELEKELYQEARECLTLLSQRLGSQKFFFGDAQNCPVGSCRPTFVGCTISVSTVPTSLASTFPGMELRYHLHARHQQALRPRRSHTDAGTRF
ncbi:metaxin-1 isoform X2 [Arvicola amphibius]|uniref:metaxin-1 isoform X2 n=1 Tax=Arvicola amphibius TaxID=1047088 RepID=UPI0018E29663|nr:metaxin-1 isoform X2 [Arvicola amphibius]